MGQKKVLYAASTSGHLRAFHGSCLQWLRGRGCLVHTAAEGSAEGLACDRHLRLPLRKRLWSPGNFIIAGRLSKILRRERYDLIVTNTSLAAFFVRLSLMPAPKGETKVVNIVHGYLFDDDTPRLKRALLLGAEKITAAVTDQVLTMNRQDSEIARKHRLSRGDVRQIPGMGVDFARFQPADAAEKRAARGALGLAPDAFVLLYAAEFSKRKNQAFLLRALAGLPENVCLLLPGDGALLEENKRLAEGLGLGGRVLFPGFVPDLGPLTRAADACVSASRIEGLPFFVMEAMHSALPPVLTRIKGHEDLVRDGENGFLYDFGDQAAFVGCVRRLMADPGLRRELGAKAAASLDEFSREAATAILTGQLARWLPEEKGGDG